METYDATYERRIKALKADVEYHKMQYEHASQESLDRLKKNEALWEWMRWVLHLQSGVGKNGGPPSSDEWIECLEQGVTYLQEEKK